MFGSFYLRWDAKLRDPQSTMTQVAYAGELLAELLNRAKALEDGLWFRAHELNGENDRVEYDAACVRFHKAAESFFDDCREARIRARRARLVAANGEDGFVVSCMDDSETDEELAMVGGALVPNEA